MADPPWKLTSIFPMWALQDFEEIDGRPSFCPEKKITNRLENKLNLEKQTTFS